MALARVRNPHAVRPWQHVLNPLSGYLLLAQALCEDPAHATAWNFGPDERDARTVGWLVEQLVSLWPEQLRWKLDGGEHPHEARWLKIDSSRARQRLGWRPPVEIEQALGSIVGWYHAMGEGVDMRALTLEQIEVLGRPAREGR